MTNKVIDSMPSKMDGFLGSWGLEQYSEKLVEMAEPEFHKAIKVFLSKRDQGRVMGAFRQVFAELQKPS